MGKKRRRWIRTTQKMRRCQDFCPTKGNPISQPIIDWSNEDVWEFIHRYDLPAVYMIRAIQGSDVSGCPMSGKAGEELEKYPKLGRLTSKPLKRCYRPVILQRCGLYGRPEQVMDWWMSG